MDSAMSQMTNANNVIIKSLEEVATMDHNPSIKATDNESEHIISSAT